jgi:tetratricopeptide (TPR) repeat protein
MEASEILSTLERLRVASALEQHVQVAHDQTTLADRVRGISAIGQAAVAAGRGNWQAVLDGAGSVDKLPPEVARFAALLRVEALLELGRSEACLDAARGMLGDDPGDVSARVLGGRALFRLRRVAEAEPELRQAVSQAPEDFQARFGLGLVLMAQGHLPQALEQLRYAQGLNPVDEGPYRALARLFRMTGQVVEGADRIGGLLKGQLVQSPGLLLDLAELELMAGRPERLPPMLLTIEEHAALEPLLLIELARLWCELADVAAVQRLVARAEGMEHPQAAAVHIVLQALLAELQGDGEAARQLHGRACTLLKGHWFPHARAALLYLFRTDQRSLNAAEAHLRQAVKLAPRTPDVRLLVAILQVARGDHSVRPSLELVAQHQGMRPSLRRLAQATLVTLDAREAQPG